MSIPLVGRKLTESKITGGIRMNEQVLKEDDAAEYLGLAVQTLRNRRLERKPPNYLKIGRSVRYRMRDLEAYLESCLINVDEN
jgi:predicted DNA-binding transcriptional regulator AlpA